MIGSAKFPMLNPLPVTLTWLIDSVPVPVFCSWKVCEAGEPCVTFPKLALGGVTFNADCNPVPETAMTVLAPCVLATVMFPVTFSEALGRNATFNGAVWPDASVKGVVIPLTLKSLALTLTCEIVTLVFPVFEMVMLFELELPALMFAKLKLAGLADRVTEAAVPVPLNGRTFGEFGALLTKLTVPFWYPAVVGAKSTLNVVLLPAATVTGVANPLSV